ncbi:MAG: GtrA family protein [Alphaproteobacteria bacterium]|nr:GtrA family protein [Alphaproteobacteria bacterium]
MSGLAWQSFRFAAVGLVNTAIGLSAIYAVLYVFRCDPAIANAAGFAIGLVVSFTLNHFWTFGDRRDKGSVLPKYVLVVAAAYTGNLVAVLVGSRQFHIDPYLVQLAGMAVYTISVFLGCRRFVYGVGDGMAAGDRRRESRQPIAANPGRSPGSPGAPARSGRGAPGNR